MINLLEESVRAAVKDTLDGQHRMKWNDSVFREHVKYYGDVEFKGENIIGDNGIASSKKYLAFRYQQNIGILSTGFDTNIEEKLASGRKAEYGSKVYTTCNIDTISINDSDDKPNINVLQWSPYNDNHLFCGDSSGTLSIFNIPNTTEHSTVLSVDNLSSSINCIASHPSSADILAVGGAGSISLIDLGKGGASFVTTKILDGSDDIVQMTYSRNSNYLRCITKDKKLLFTYDPRCDTEIKNSIALQYAPNNIVNLYNDNEIAVCGLTSYLEPVVYAYDVTGGLTEANIYEKYIFKENWSHKHCAPMIKYDRSTQLLYITFRGCADLLTLNTSNKFDKEGLYHAANDTFMGFDMLPKHSVKKREINRIIKFSKNRVQKIVHSRGGKLVYEKIASQPKKSLVSVSQYFEQKENVSYPEEDIAKVIPMDFEEQKKRSVSVYTHVAGKEPQNTRDQYYDLKISQTVNCNLGQNIKANSKYALFPSPTYGGGALGVIELNATGRKKQKQLSGHSEKISTFDVCQIKGNEHLVISGSPDFKAIVYHIKDDGIHKVFTLSCVGKVTFVGFHPRIDGLCVVASNGREGGDKPNESMVYLYDYKEGKVIGDGPTVIENGKNIMDIQFESVIGLIAAISCSSGQIKLMDIQTAKILAQFRCDTFMRDTKLFWATNNGRNTPKYMNQLITLGFARGSVRKFCLYDVNDVVEPYYRAKLDNDDNKENAEEEEKKEAQQEIECIDSLSFGVSNGIPIGHYDSNDNLFYVTSVGDRKIRCYEFTKKGIHPVTASFQSQSDIQGITFKTKQSVNAKKVEIAVCLKLTKDGVINPVSFNIPRKRMEYFQDDIFSDILDVVDTTAVSMEEVFADEAKKLNINISYVSLQPKHMELLSNAPEEELTERQKRRNSQVAQMEANKLKQQPQSTEQAFDQFSRMVADAPTANRWDAENIGTEVADDEWDD